MQLNKNIKIFINYFFGPLLFTWLAYSIYHQVTHQAHLEGSWQQIKQSFQSYKIVYLFFAIGLIPVNWGLEAWKWKLSVQSIHPVKFLHAFKAVLSGVSFSVSMPNRIGEYLGRMLYMPEGSRLKTISVTLVGSYAQLLVTIFFGITGLVFLKKDLLQHFPGLRIWYQFAVYGIGILTVILLFIYFQVASAVVLFRRWIRSEKYMYLVEALGSFGTSLLVRVLALSFFRYLVFIIQYILVFYLFEVNLASGTILLVMGVVFLAMAVIPSISLIEVGLRGEISIMLMGMYSVNALGIGFTSVTVWIINLILPAIAGSVLLLNQRVFNKRSERG